MQRNLRNISDTPPFSCNFETAGYTQGAAFTGSCSYRIPDPLNFVSPNVGDQLALLEFEPCSKCPQNLIVFDQTDVKHRVMYNPAFVQKLNLENLEVKDLNKLHNSASFKEDTNEIDILLSSDEGENFDDDTVSTGRTPYNWYSTSCNSGSCDSTCGGPDWNDCSREKMQKMVCLLREIVPGMEGLDAGTVLDEAVKYLKHLKTEVEKLGISNFDCGIP